MKMPLLKVDLTKLEYNLKALQDLSKKCNFDLTFVTKAYDTNPAIVDLLISSNVKSLADSRYKNLQKISRQHSQIELQLLRPCGLDEVSQLMNLSPICYGSSIEYFQELNHQAKLHKKNISALIFIEQGDFRDGVPLEKANELIEQVLLLKNITLLGVAGNHACLRGLVPELSMMSELEALRSKYSLKYSSAGNSSLLELLFSKGQAISGVNHLRVGESFLTGRDVLKREPLSFLKQDAIELEAEIFELYYKKVNLEFNQSQNAFGEKSMLPLSSGFYAVLGIGRMDFGGGELKPQDERVKIVGSSSDHLVVFIEDSYAKELKVGHTLKFWPSYSAFIFLFRSVEIASA